MDPKLHAQMALDLNQPRAAREYHASMAERPKFYYFAGALLCDREVPGLTQPLHGHRAALYCGRHFVCDEVFKGSARRIAEALGGSFVEGIPPQ